MADLHDISISTEATEVAETIFEQRWFKNRADILSFAAGYMIKHHFSNFDPSTYVLSNSQGLNYGISTFDADGKWSMVIRGLYPNAQAPYSYLRALMDKGLLLLGQQMKDDPSYSIVSELE